MDWPALLLSLRLALWTCGLLLPLALLVARNMVRLSPFARRIARAAVSLPLMLPPTVLGLYLLQFFGKGALLGELYAQIFGGSLVFSFQGLVLASLLFNLPFAVQPLERAFAAIPANLREAAWVSGLSGPATFLRIELPLALPGLVTAFALVFAHTMGEFGVVLMVGGAIPGETRTASIAIYDSVQALDMETAGAMAAMLLAVSFATVLLASFMEPEREGLYE